MMDGEAVPETPIYATPSSIISRRSTDTLAVADIRLAKAVGFFLQNYMNFISVEDAVRVAGVSRGLLTRLFQRQFGKSPRRFLQEIRMNQIRHLLDGTELPLAEVARRRSTAPTWRVARHQRETGITPAVTANPAAGCRKESPSHENIARKAILRIELTIFHIHKIICGSILIHDIVELFRQETILIQEARVL